MPITGHSADSLLLRRLVFIICRLLLGLAFRVAWDSRQFQAIYPIFDNGLDLGVWDVWGQDLPESKWVQGTTTLKNPSPRPTHTLSYGRDGMV